MTTDTPLCRQAGRALSPPAGVLLGLLLRRSRSWTELSRAGLDREAVLRAVGELAARGSLRLTVGPLCVTLDTGPGAAGGEDA